MSYVSLYRKYRPDTFDKVIGQDHIVRILVNQVNSGTCAHAYLFTGTRGTGKTSVARILAKSANCLNPSNGSPCGKCEICKDLASPNHIDIIEIDAASNNSVDDVRDIRDKVGYAPSKAKYKVYIIDEVHQLTGAAFNALLKTLEEPPEHVIFVLATTEAHKIPQTILSRCIKLDFRLVSVDALADHVKKIYDLEGVKYTNDAIFAIARAGEGSVRDTLSVADMCMSYADGDITYEKVLDVLGANNPLIVADIVNNMLDCNLSAVLSLIDKTASLGKSVPVFARDITKFLRDLLIIKNEKNANNYLNLPDKIYSYSKEIADKFDSVIILRALEIMSGIDMNMKYSSYPRILLETAVSKIATVEGESKLDLMSKISNIEKKIESGYVAKTKEKSVDINNNNYDGENIPNAETHQSKTNPDERNNNSKKEIIKEELTELNDLPEEIANVDDTINTDYDAMKKLKGNIISELRRRNIIMLSIILSDDSTYLQNIDNVITICCKNDADKDFCKRNETILKECVDKLIGNHKLQFDINQKNKDDDTIDKIVGLFGDSAVTIKK